jgi:D-inositol-3-phosphate glycosyltransferase
VKIVCIGPAYPLRGGIADFNEQLTRSLLVNKDDVSIVSYSMQYPKILFPGKTQLSNSESPKDLLINSILHSTNPINWCKVAKKIQSQNPDIVIIHYWMPFFAPALGTIAKKIKKNTKIKVIAICHNLLPHEQKPGDKLLTKYFTKQCDAFIGMSHSVIEDIKKIAPTKEVIYSPHPLYDNFGEKAQKDEACSFLQLPNTGKYVLFFGLVRKYKGLDLLLQAFTDTRIRELQLKLIIAGEFYENESIYRNFITNNNLESSIIIQNEFIPQNQVRYYFGATDIVAQTYHSATQSGITQIAFHFGTPMLVTNVGGLSEIIHEDFGYVTEKNPTKIADALIDFFKNDKKDLFSKAVEKEKEKYTWTKFVEKLKTIY